MAETAIQELNGTMIQGTMLEVRFADHDAGTVVTDNDRAPPSDNVYCKAGRDGMQDRSSA